MANQLESVYFRYGGESMAFVCGTQSVDVPEQVVNRCGLLADLCNQMQQRADVSLPFSFDDAIAWLDCVNLLAAGDSSSLLEKDYCTALSALKVRVRHDSFHLDKVKSFIHGIRFESAENLWHCQPVLFASVSGIHPYGTPVHCHAPQTGLGKTLIILRKKVLKEQ